MKLSQSKLCKLNQINVKQTINSGQVFLWEKLNDSWYGIDGQNIIKIAQEPILNQNQELKILFSF